MTGKKSRTDSNSEPRPNALRYEVDVRSPTDAPAQLRQAFMLLVRKGGEVRENTLAALVTDALALGFVHADGILAAVGGIKRPSIDYRAKVFAKASLADPGRFPYELGWVFVEERHRGMGVATALVSELGQRLGDRRAYATSRVDNENMHRSLARAGFKPAGAPYPSTRKGETLQVFLRETADGAQEVRTS